MSHNLESAANAQSLRRIAIDPLTRVEGHGKVTLLVDDENHVHQVRLHIVEFRGFEKFIQGRPYWELPVLVQRLCGICPVSHHLAAAKAVDLLVGAGQLTPTAEKLRRLMHRGQILQSHALHFFHLSAPDLLFGYDDAVAHRNVVGLVAEHPELAMKGVQLRKFGQEVIRAISGKRVHGTAALPGGMNKSLTVAERDTLLADVDQMIEWAGESVALIKRIIEKDPAHHSEFAAIRSNLLSLVGKDGALDLYHGQLRARDADGAIIFENVDYREYTDYIHEQVKPWSYMKFPFIASLGSDSGWYRVGPLARMNNCDFIPTPLAEAERQAFVATGEGKPVHATLAYHWARMIEMLFSAEAIKMLLMDDDILGTDLMTSGDRQSEGIGVIEAPRGTLFHHYCVNDDGLVEKANLIVSTTNNNQAMNESIRQVANRYLDGQEITEALLNHIEVAVRAYDPCLSCATHALGKMPLVVELAREDGQIIDRRIRGADGIVC
ncbi:MAG: Ni/Fe hydrogenase subunit alpha [Gammaproteobacteria bacterium]|nr:MAG: Ni/Fe hydrogenase subunit alpha [Gammaproteobacteria bacterium]